MIKILILSGDNKLNKVSQISVMEFCTYEELGNGEYLITEIVNGKIVSTTIISEEQEDCTITRDGNIVYLHLVDSDTGDKATIQMYDVC